MAQGAIPGKAEGALHVLALVVVTAQRLAPGRCAPAGLALRTCSPKPNHHLFTKPGRAQWCQAQRRSRQILRRMLGFQQMVCGAVGDWTQGKFH